MEFADYLPIFCGGCILFWVFFRFFMKRKRCTLKVLAICVEHKRRHNKATYTPVFDIPWQGGRLRIHSRVYFNKIGKIHPAVGKEIWLRINPQNPLEFSSPHDLQAEIAPILVALIFIFLPIYFNFFHTT